MSDANTANTEVQNATPVAPAAPVSEDKLFEVSAANVHLIDSYISICEKNKKFYGTQEKAFEFLLNFALENLIKREQNTLDRHNTDNFMRDKAELEKMYDLLLNSKSPMSLEDKYAREKQLMFKYSIGTKRSNQ